jgi:hypothetical protein
LYLGEGLIVFAQPPNKDMNLTSSAWHTVALLASYVQRSADQVMR